MSKLYVLFYDFEDGGDRESWSVFYTPCEIFTDPAMRQARKEFIEAANPELACEFRDVEVSTVSDGPIDEAFEADND